MKPHIEEAWRLFRLACRDRNTFVLLYGLPQASEAAIGFHAQQAVEKAIKAVLFKHEQTFRRIHDLEELAALLKDLNENVPCTLDALRLLNPYAVEFRYQEGGMMGMGREAMLPVVEAVCDWCELRLAADGKD